jgi:hypothetical protein
MMLAVPKVVMKLMPVAGNAQALAKCILSGYAGLPVNWNMPNDAPVF